MNKAPDFLHTYLDKLWDQMETQGINVGSVKIDFAGGVTALLTLDIGEPDENEGDQPK